MAGLGQTVNLWFVAGRLVEADVVAVTARVSGLVAELMVHDNQAVKKGDAILRLDDADLQTRLAQARAELQTAQAQVDQAVETVKNLLVMGDGDDAGFLLDGKPVDSLFPEEK